MNSIKSQRIKPLKENFSAWYESIIEHAQLAQSCNVKGTFFILPRAWAIWENIQNYINLAYKKINVQNVAFPTLLPYQELAKEKEHIKGFAPELFWLESKNNEQKLVLRPTSEIFFCNYFKNNLQSHHQLPILLNQWCNVFRIEKNTKAFLRTCEFYWHELHTIHATLEDANLTITNAKTIYEKLFVDVLDLAIITGPKTINERFAGADHTYTFEAIMQDGQMLQSATAHDLNQNFAKAFNIQFQNANNQKTFAYQTSAGLSTRVLGAIIMAHSDDLGLVLPFNIADTQIRLISLNKTKNHPLFYEWKNTLANFRIEIDDSDKSLGYKLQNSELFGTPITIILGEKELSQNEVLVILRHDLKKRTIKIGELISKIPELIKEYKDALLVKSQKRLTNAITLCHTLEEVKKTIIQQKIALVAWFNDKENEIQFKQSNLGFTPRCIKEYLPNDTKLKCFFSNKKANTLVYFARAY